MISTLKFVTEINSPKEKVWQQLWDDNSYRTWTAAFMEGSYAESDWNEGSKIKFLSPGGDGMFGIIEKKIPYVEMTFKHLGEIKKGIEEPKDWAGAKESYHLQDKGGATELTVQIEIDDQYKEYFNNTFPKALAVLKRICEE